VRDDQSSDHVLVVPNPASTEATITIPSAFVRSGSEIVITDILGRVVYHAFSMPGQEFHTVNVSRFATGAYRCRIDGGSAVLSGTLRIIR
jgi:predicted Fe-Mo cluster-binding NifX family protein